MLENESSLLKLYLVIFVSKSVIKEMENYLKFSLRRSLLHIYFLSVYVNNLIRIVLNVCFLI